MDLRKLRYFVAVVDAGSITSAAQRLHISQPPLSAAIRQLESEVGAPLLERKPRGVVPTIAGELMYTQGRHLLDSAERLEREVLARGQGMAGSLRVGSEPVGHWNLVGRVAAGFSKAFPDLELTLLDAPPGELVRQLRHHELDLAVIPTVDTDGMRQLLGPQFRVVPVTSLPLQVCVSSEEVCGASGPACAVMVTELLDRTWIMPRRIPGVPIIPEAMDTVFDAVGARPARILKVSTPNTAIPLVAVGLGVAVVTPGVVQHLTTVTELPIVGGLPNLQLVAAHPVEGIARLATQRFLHSLTKADERGVETTHS